MKVPLLVCATMCIASIFRGQDCADVLRLAAKDEFRSTTNDEVVTKIDSFMNMSWEEVRSEKKKSRLGLRTPYGALTGNMSKETFEKWKHDYTSNQSFFNRQALYQQIYSSVVNPSAIQAWKDCVTGKKILAWYSATHENTVVVTVQYKLREADDRPSVRITQVELSPNLTAVNGQYLSAGAELKAFGSLVQTYRRENLKEAQVVVNVEGRDPVTILIPEVLPPPPQPVDFEQVLFREGEEIAVPITRNGDLDPRSKPVQEDAWIDLKVEETDDGFAVKMGGFVVYDDAGGGNYRRKMTDANFLNRTFNFPNTTELRLIPASATGSMHHRRDGEKGNEYQPWTGTAGQHADFPASNLVISWRDSVKPNDGYHTIKLHEVKVAGKRLP